MNTNNMTQQQISAFADGEMADAHVETILAALHTPEGRAAWTDYHQIGDAVRSDELNFSFSPDFAARMSARLDAEPSIVSPMRRITEVESESRSSGNGNAIIVSPKRSLSFKRFALPTMSAAVAAVAIGFVAGPQLMMVATKDSTRSATVASASSGQGDGNRMKTVALASQREVVLRDPRIDDYLLAHQRFSPSLYSTAQYARSATFATDTDK